MALGKGQYLSSRYLLSIGGLHSILATSSLSHHCLHSDFRIGEPFVNMAAEFGPEWKKAGGKSS
jgi:hypothetical protein